MLVTSTKDLRRAEREPRAPYDTVSNAYDVTRRPDPRLVDAILDTPAMERSRYAASCLMRR
jgi:hypothetical protein